LKIESESEKLSHFGK